FEQKTAYEIETCLEFRRVLFRSVAGGTVGPVVVPRRDRPGCVASAELLGQKPHTQVGLVGEQRQARQCRLRRHIDTGRAAVEVFPNGAGGTAQQKEGGGQGNAGQVGNGEQRRTTVETRRDRPFTGPAAA